MYVLDRVCINDSMLYIYNEFNNTKSSIIMIYIVIHSVDGEEQNFHLSRNKGQALAAFFRCRIPVKIEVWQESQSGFSFVESFNPELHHA